ASVEPSTPRDTESLLLSEDEGTDVDESMEEESSSDEDSEMEDTSSEASDEPEDDVGGDDANLTVEELRQKYSDVLTKDSIPPESDDNADEEENEAMEVDDDEISGAMLNGDVSVNGDGKRVKRGDDIDIPSDDLADNNSIFDEDEDDDSPMDSEEDEDSEDEDESEDEVP